jgi:FkbM family methyltransferase
VEPVPQAVRTLRILFGRSPKLQIVPAAAGKEIGSLPLLICGWEPTVSTLSRDWAERMLRERHAFARTRWDRSIEVPVTTLDQLIAVYGEPAFCKIDTEGYDLEVCVACRGRCVPCPSNTFRRRWTWCTHVSSAYPSLVDIRTTGH